MADGRYLYPFWNERKEKVSDYLTDRKFSVIRKEQQWILCRGDKIAWVIGERTDNRFRIDGNTKRVIILKINEE